MKNIKVVHAKETIMTSNNITEAVTQKQSTERYPIYIFLIEKTVGKKQLQQLRQVTQ